MELQIENYKDKHEYISENGIRSVVYLMDCIEGLKQIPDKYFKLAIVDPPYGIGITKQFEDANKAGTKSMFKQTKGIVKKDWDAEIPTAEYFDELNRVSKKQIIWGGITFLII